MRASASRNGQHGAQQSVIRHHAIAYAVGLAMGSLILTASPGTAEAQAAVEQLEGLRQSYDIPAGPLATALSSLASAANVLLTFTSEQTSGKTTAGIRGQYTVQEALAAVLAQTGLLAVRMDNGGYVLRTAPEPAVVPTSKPPSAQESTLPAVRVTAQSARDGTTEGSGSFTTRSTSAATGLNLSLRETPQSITVVTRQRLDDQALSSLGQVLAQVPGLSVSGSSLQSSNSEAPIFSRGYLLSNFQIDGAVASPFTFSEAGTGWAGVGALQTVLYDSVTVVRGAAGLLSGAGDPSGTINLVRKRPLETFQASVSGSAGRWGQYRAVGDVGGPLNDAGTLRGRLVVSADEGKSWVDRYQQERRAAYAVLDADLGKATVLSLALESHDGNFKGVGNQTSMPVIFADDGTVTPFSRSDNATANWSYSNERKNVASLALEHRFNDDWEARLRYAYTSLKVDSKSGNILGINRDGSISVFRPIRYISPTRDGSHEWDLRLNGRYTLLGRRHEVMAGFNGYRTQERSNRNSLGFGTTTASWLDWNGAMPEPDWAGIPQTKSRYKTEQAGVFLATRLRPTDALSVILGGRLSTWRTSTVDELTGSTTDDRKESSVFTPYSGIVYDLTGWLSTYASYTEIFKPQSYKGVDGRFLDPEEGKNYEIGLKGEWFGGRLNASAAVFKTRKDNLAVHRDGVFTPAGEDAYSAEDGTKASGWELEVSGELARGWHLQAGFARIVSRDSDGGLLNSGFVPKHSFKLFTTWTPAQFTGLTIGGGVLWQSEINQSSYAAYYSAAQLALLRQKSYAVASLMAQYRFNDRLSLLVNLNNLFDKVYRNNVYYHEYGAPRNLYATLKYQF